MPALTNAKHELFAQNVVKGQDATGAYKAAGYEATGNAAESAASRLLRHKLVKARIEEIKNRGAEMAGVSREWVIDKLVSNVKRAMQEEAVLVGGEPSGEFKYDGSVANRALELLGKELGMFVERTENLNIHNVVSDVPLTDEQWSEKFAETRH